MRAGTIGSAEQIIEPSLDHHAGTVVFGKLQQLPAKAVSIADDRMNEVLDRLSFDRDLALQTGEGVVPRR